MAYCPKKPNVLPISEAEVYSGQQLGIPLNPEKDAVCIFMPAEPYTPRLIGLIVMIVSRFDASSPCPIMG